MALDMLILLESKKLNVPFEVVLVSALSLFRIYQGGLFAFALLSEI